MFESSAPALLVWLAAVIRGPSEAFILPVDVLWGAVVVATSMRAREGLALAAGAVAAACWLAAAGHFAYTTNAGSGSIGRFAIARDGSLSLIGTTVVGAGSTPLDNAATHDQKYMYVLLGGSHKIVGYRVGHDGDLTQVASVDVPVGAAGQAAR